MGILIYQINQIYCFFFCGHHLFLIGSQYRVSQPSNKIVFFAARQSTQSAGVVYETK